jgi:hypothetical protein
METWDEHYDDPWQSVGSGVDSSISNLEWLFHWVSQRGKLKFPAFVLAGPLDQPSNVQCPEHGAYCGAAKLRYDILNGDGDGRARCRCDDG